MLEFPTSNEIAGNAVQTLNAARGLGRPGWLGLGSDEPPMFVQAPSP